MKALFQFIAVVAGLCCSNGVFAALVLSNLGQPSGSDQNWRLGMVGGQRFAIRFATGSLTTDFSKWRLDAVTVRFSDDVRLEKDDVGYFRLTVFKTKKPVPNFLPNDIWVGALKRDEKPRLAGEYRFFADGDIFLEPGSWYNLGMHHYDPDYQPGDVDAYFPDFTTVLESDTIEPGIGGEWELWTPAWEVRPGSIAYQYLNRGIEPHIAIPIPQFSIEASPVPEPSSIGIVMLSGAALFVLWRKRRERRQL